MNFLVLIFVLLGNLWIWKILDFNILLGLIVVATSIFLYLALVRKNKNYLFIFFGLFTLLLIFQWKTTEVKSLTQLSNDEQRVQQMRLREYPPRWLRVGHWFEERPESIAFFRILDNFSEVVDPNLYFFANHPRERVGFNEFEKFPYIFIPFFLYGLLLSVRRNRNLFLLSVVLPFIIISLIGNKNPLGPFSFFPFIVAVSVVGLESAHKNLKSRPAKYIKALTIGFFVLYSLVLLQMIAYAIY